MAIIGIIFIRSTTENAKQTHPKPEYTITMTRNAFEMEIIKLNILGRVNIA